jgi:hypothetical protein
MGLGLGLIWPPTNETIQQAKQTKNITTNDKIELI